MPRRPAAITQADVARVLRAMRDAGGGVVEVRPDGTMLVRIGGAGEEAARGNHEPDGNRPLAVL